MVKFSFAGHRRALSKVTRNALRYSRMALIAEGLAQALWPAFTVICFTAAVALLGGFSRLDASSHRVALLFTIGLLAAAFLWGALRFRMPSRVEAARRLDAGDAAHPIATLSDKLSAGANNDTSQRIWLEHQRRAERAAARLRARAPDLRLSRFDRWALRMFAPVMVIAGLISAGGTWTERLGTLFAPVPEISSAPVAATRNPMVEGWAIAPAYTGQGTIYLNKHARSGGEISVPEGSELILRVTDLGRPPVLSAPGLTGFDGFTDFGGALAEARGVLTGTGRVEISDGNEGGTVLTGWDITVIADAPPTISMPTPPGGTLTDGFAGELEVFFEARDDYGIDTAWAEVVPMGGIVPGKGLDLEPITFALPLPIAGRALEVVDSAVHDLGAHPWAGDWVELRLFAEDGAGQRATAGPVTLRLPGRNFTHPLARALIEQRRELAIDFEQGTRVLDVLQAVTRRPEQVFSDKSGAYLGVRLAIRQLADGVVMDSVSQVAPEVVEILWLAALSLEDGELSSSLERLRTAEEALRRALESGTDEEVRRAMDELRAAMDEYIEEMIRQALERGLEPGDQEQGGEQRQLSQEDLEEMLDEMERRADSGLRDQARDMLSELSRMLNNLQAGPQQQQHGTGGQRSLEALQEMIQRQRDLADRTFDDLRRQRRNGQQQGNGSEGENGLPQPGQGGQPGQGDGQVPGEQGRPGSLAAEQEALRRALEELASQLPGGSGEGGDESTRQAIEQALEEAARAMGEARDDLTDRQPGDAVEDQMEALDRLSEGATAMAESLRNGQGDVTNRGRRRREGEAGDLESDPFDRPTGAFGAIDGRDTKVPDRAALDRARQVLEELRRRAAETYRPQIELDYLDRLMDQF